MKVRYKVFRGTLTTWPELFRQAAEFSSRLAPEDLISISHSADRSDGVVTVWYRAGARDFERTDGVTPETCEEPPAPE